MITMNINTKSLIKLVALGLSALGLSGCLTDVVFYKHSPTNGLRKEATLNDLEAKEKFVVGGILFVPDFSEFSPSNGLSRSFILGYSEFPVSLFVSQITLTGVRGHGVFELDLNEELEINRPLGELHRGDVLLTGLKSFDFGSLEGEKQINLKIIFMDGDGQKHEVSFLLERVIRKDVAWET